MLRNALTSTEGLISFLLVIPTLLIALSFHEYAHALCAYRLGDPTARAFGRLTLSPRKHLDPIGTLCLLICGFGWAKPVPVNTRHLKKPRRDMMLIALCGPVANLLLSFLGYLFLRTVFSLRFSISSDALYTVLYTFFYYFCTVNLALAIFNFLPIPPLDGSRLLGLVLPHKWYYRFLQYERQITLILFLLLIVGALDWPIGFLQDGMLWLFDKAIGWIPFFGGAA